LPLTKLQFRPGINRDVTSYSNEGGWVDCEKIRFRLGYPEIIGGWEKYSSQTYIGTVRSLFNWVALDGDDLLGIGTHQKFYVEQGAEFYDITPIRATTTNGITFSATDGSSTITATDSAHGAVEGDFVTLSGASSLGGNITAAVLNQEYQIVSVPSTSTYTFVAKDTSGATVTANSSDSGNGGSGVDGVYQINTGLNTSVGGTGWGTGTWGRGTWGSGTDITTVTQLRTWSQDNFGEDLLFNPRDGAIFFWDKSDGLTQRAVNITSLTNSIDAPTIAKQIMVSDNDRHVIAFGCNPVGSGEQDPLLIRFSDQENVLDWLPKATNTAGDLRIGSGSEFVKAIETKREIVIFTNNSVHSMQFIGAPFTFGIQPISSHITIMGSNAAVAVNESIFWMGKENFYIYDGQVKELPCTVKEKVFFDFNSSQPDKVFAGVISEFTEVIWFYCSDANSVANGGDGENDKYVIFNYGEGVWYYGSLSRTAFIDRGIRQFPIAAGGQYLYNHEIGYLDDGSAIVSSIESSPIDVGDGDRFVSISRIIPDLTFNGSGATSPVVDITVKGGDFPGGSYGQSDLSSVTRTATSSTVPFEQYTNKADIRVRGRTFALKVDSTQANVRWRLGSPRIEVRQDGRR
tara:strand:- start:437 stop:2323 length:1887 start_codon:yes stop_codon:yes gene_type:complete